MHEHGLMKAVVEHVLRVADGKVTAVTLRCGELSGVAPDHLVEHFRMAAQGTPIEHATVRVEPGPGGGVRLESIEVEAED